MERQNAIRDQSDHDHARWISGDLYETRRTRHRELAVVLPDFSLHASLSCGLWWPEVDQRKIAVTSVTLASDGLSASSLCNSWSRFRL